MRSEGEGSSDSKERPKLPSIYYTAFTAEGNDLPELCERRFGEGPQEAVDSRAPQSKSGNC